MLEEAFRSLPPFSPAYLISKKPRDWLGFNHDTSIAY